MIDVSLDRDFPKEINIDVGGKYVDVMAELAWINIYIAKRLEAISDGKNAEEILSSIAKTAIKFTKEV